MILLRPDCLVFKTSNGENIPCSAKEVTMELIGEAVACMDEETIRNAAEAVLHYFKAELGRSSVTLGEFTLALEKVLRDLGLNVKSTAADEPSLRVVEADLERLAVESGRGLELFFFPRLRDELRTKLNESPQVLRFRGLRGCVKELTGAKRWNPRCQNLHDQIVDYLRTCLSVERSQESCALVVS